MNLTAKLAGQRLVPFDSACKDSCKSESSFKFADLLKSKVNTKRMGRNKFEFSLSFFMECCVFRGELGA